jgi:hypothetical protein
VYEANPDDIFLYFESSDDGTRVWHWEKKAPTVNAMRDDFIETNDPDIAFPRTILERYFQRCHLNPISCADVACGIRHVSLARLSHYFRRITLVEPVDKFIDKAEADLKSCGIQVRKFNYRALDWEIDEDYDCI